MRPARPRRGSARSAALAALAAALTRQRPGLQLDDKGYAADFRQTLLAGVAPEDFEADLRAGSGNELATKFRAAHSSCGLAVNCFAPFRRRLADLNVPGLATATGLDFERKCPAGIAGRTPPNLDVVLTGPQGVVGIESKLTETLGAHTCNFSPDYDNEIRDDRRDHGWFREMHRLMKDKTRYKHLDAAQLIKHAFGLAHSFAGQPVTLLYLFWEPVNADAFAVFAAHRREIAEFSGRVAGPGPAFRAMSYPELWSRWRDRPALPAWLAAHLEQVTGRYLLRI